VRHALPTYITAAIAMANSSGSGRLSARIIFTYSVSSAVHLFARWGNAKNGRKLMAAPAMERIKGRDCGLYRDGTPPVYMTPDGRFAVFWDNKWQTRASLKSIDNLTLAHRPAIALFQMDNSEIFHDCQPRIVMATEWRDNSLLDKDGKRVWRGYGNWYRFDAKRIEALKALEKKRKEFEKEIDKEFTRIMKGAVPIYKDDFKELIAKKEKI
jgi:hypothetical protein